MLQRVYLDSCVLIYLLEGQLELAEKIRAALIGEQRTLCVSGLVRLECLIGPLRASNTELIERYGELFDRMEDLHLTTNVFELAAKIRAKDGLLVPDALHLATAEINGCDEFWTADFHFKKITTPMKSQVRFIQ